MARWFVVSIRAIIACARAGDNSDDFKLTVGLALVGMVGIAGMAPVVREKVGSRARLGHDRTSKASHLTQSDDRGQAAKVDARTTWRRSFPSRLPRPGWVATRFPQTPPPWAIGCYIRCLLSRSMPS